MSQNIDSTASHSEHPEQGESRRHGDPRPTFASRPALPDHREASKNADSAEDSRRSPGGIMG
jgi:hypothetical protein